MYQTILGMEVSEGMICVDVWNFVLETQTLMRQSILITFDVIYIHNYILKECVYQERIIGGEGWNHYYFFHRDNQVK